MAEANVKRRQCASCQAPILWLEHEKTNKMAPIDANPDPEKGNLFVWLDQGVYGVIRPSELEAYRDAYPMRIHTNHFMTCPNAARHRPGA